MAESVFEIRLVRLLGEKNLRDLWLVIIKDYRHYSMLNDAGPGANGLLVINKFGFNYLSSLVGQGLVHRMMFSLLNIRGF